MTDKKRQRMMFVLLTASVLFGVYMKPWERRVRTVNPVQPQTTTTAALAEAAAPETQNAISLVSEWPTRDPFTRPEEFKSQHAVIFSASVSLDAPSFVVQGVMTVEGQMVCVIDGQVCHVGSQVSGWRVDRIDTQGAWVSQGGERHFVPLP
jgi:hypothetical protein